MQTILGAGGPTANSLQEVLEKTGVMLRLVSRSKIRTTGNTSWHGADLKDYPAMLDAAKGSSVVYLCAGLKYDHKVWQAEWPLIMKNFIQLGKETGAHLIFFDNVYMYGRVQAPMTEETPYNPISIKGEVRARIAMQLIEESQRGNIKATIARAADFYGASSMNSFFDSMVLAKYAKGSRAQWMGNPEKLHSFTFVPDTGAALALLGSKPETASQIWHLPTAPALTGLDFIKLAAGIFQTAPKYTAISKTMLRLIGLFSPLVAGTVEMFYQYEHDYSFSSARFAQEFGLLPTSYETGIQQLKGTLFKQ